MNPRVFIDIAKQVSLSRLKSYSKIEDVELQAVKSEVGVYGHWMAIILLFGRSIKITIKTHFRMDATRSFAARAFGTDQSQLTDSQARDFAKEYCNLTAGALKRIFEDQKEDVGISLPLLTRGFDEIFTQGNQQVETTEGVDYWSLKFGDRELIVSAQVDIYDPASLAAKTWLYQEGKKDDIGEVDFL